MQLTIDEVRHAVGGKLLRGDPEAVISGVSTDSRTVKAGDLFIALRGDRHDGHDYLEEIFDKGAAGAVIDRDVEEGGVAVRVDDTLKALGDLAQDWRSRLPVRVVAVTGSNGKTTTKDMIAALLAARYRVLKTEGNFNNLIGLPHTVFRMDEKTEVAVLEMGMNRPGEIRRLSSIARPEVGLITNVARAHLEGLGTLRAVAQAKAELLESLPKDGWAILNDRDPSFRLLKKYVKGRLKTPPRPRHVKATLAGTSFSARIGKKSVSFSMPILGVHNMSNALLALSVAESFGVPPAAMQKVFKALPPGVKRMEVVRLGKKIDVINDCYNANPDSMAASLAFLKTAGGSRRRVAILGDMFELGRESSALHREVGRRAVEASVRLLVGVGPHAPDLEQGARKAGLTTDRIFSFESVEASLPVLLALIRPGDLVLVKGSRGMKMETITEKLKHVL